MTRVPLRALLLWALLAPSLGCAERAPRQNLAASTATIVAGVASGPEQDGVVLLRATLDNGDLLCSASLVAPNLLITARHCVSYYTDGLFSCTVRGELTDNLDGAGELGQHLLATSLEVYGRKTPRRVLARGQQVLSTLAPSVCINDLAFVVLDQDIDLPIIPLRLGRSAEPHESVTLVGYGLDGEQQSLDFQNAKRRQKTGLAIAAVGPDSAADGVEDVPPRALILRGPSGCIGDSGGPLLAASSGALLGVYSLQSAQACTDPAALQQLVHVAPFQNLLDEAFAAAGAEPLAEPTAEPDAGSEADASASAGAPSDAGTGPTLAAGAAGTPNETGPQGSGAPTSSCGFAPPPRAAQHAAMLLALLAPLVRRRRAV
jgi:Trypsin